MKISYNRADIGLIIGLIIGFSIPALGNWWFMESNAEKLFFSEFMKIGSAARAGDPAALSLYKALQTYRPKIEQKSIAMAIDEATRNSLPLP